jgi:hypothetical protein
MMIVGNTSRVTIKGKVIPGYEQRFEVSVLINFN